MKFQHGGMLEKIKHDYPEQGKSWIDLSTGVSPFSYPVNIQSISFEGLPQHHQALNNAASKYYGVDELLMIPGSMWAIQHLPLLRKMHVQDERMVLLPKEGFNEHIKAWRLFGFTVETYERKPTAVQLDRAQACIVINPNNPTGEMLQRHELVNMLTQLNKNNAWLVVDEAFIDTAPSENMSEFAKQDGLIVLRSFGKFFGLPGLRLGALIASSSLLNQACALLNEWTINNAAQQVAIKALLDDKWQAEMKAALTLNTNRIKALLTGTIGPTVGTELFQTVYTKNAKNMHEYLLKNGIYTRLLDGENGIRFGLPKEEWQWSRLEHVLSDYQTNHKI